jgi:archaellum component FlaC
MSYLRKIEQRRELTRIEEGIHKCDRKLASSAAKVHGLNAEVERLNKSIAKHEALKKLAERVTDEICKAVV